MEANKNKKNGAMLQIWLMFLVMGVVLASGFFLIPKTEDERQKMMSFLGTTNTGEIVTPVADFGSFCPVLTVSEAQVENTCCGDKRVFRCLRTNDI